MNLLKIQQWCRAHKVPYLHGCLWDRDCRSHGAPPRISVLWGNRLAWVDLPGRYRHAALDDPAWQWGHVGYYRRPAQ